MLRVTIHNLTDTVTMQCEGRLAGPWVKEVEDCWQRTHSAQPGSRFRLDLTSVTAIDAAGKMFLAAAHARGAELVAAGCLMRAIVADITKTPPAANVQTANSIHQP